MLKQLTEFKVNIEVKNDQYRPFVTGLINNKFVVTWTSIGQDGSGAGIYGQIYSNNGSTYQEEFKVNTRTSNDQYESYIAGLNDGKFVIVWTSVGQDGSGAGIYGQMYYNNGSRKRNIVS